MGNASQRNYLEIYKRYSLNTRFNTYSHLATQLEQNLSPTSSNHSVTIFRSQACSFGISVYVELYTVLQLSFPSYPLMSVYMLGQMFITEQTHGSISC